MYRNRLFYYLFLYTYKQKHVIHVDVGKLWQGGEMGLFQKFEDESVFNNIDHQLLDNNGYWVPLTYR